MWILSTFVLCAVLGSSLQRSTPQDDHYVAAVVEYIVNRNVESNKANYEAAIKEAADQNADIVVFPELTLTNGTTSFAVPIFGLLTQYPIPALRPDLYDDLLVSMSAAARQNSVYLVINVRESVDCTVPQQGEECPEAKVYVFNTNVVFDRNGSVIDRYRKINLFGEFTHTPALKPDLGVFSTDFGVTFGHFICFDLMFQVPAIQVAQKHNLKDVIFTTMWFSEMPYLTAVQIQEAYAYTMDVNFLASGANNVRVGSAGSGIYSGKAGALVSIMPGLPTTKVLVAKVPKVPGQVTEIYPGPIYDKPSDHDSLVLIQDPSLAAHVTRPLVQGFQEFTLTDKDVSCTFRVRLNQRSNTKYQYRAAAFSGVRSFSGVETGGTRVCSVVSCYGDTKDTCGKRFTSFEENSTALFEELTITARMPTSIMTDLDADDFVVFPVALQVSIMPLETKEYTYNKTVTGNVTVHSMSLLNSSPELYTFAIWGRVFATDGQEADPPFEDSSSVRYMLSTTLLLTTMLLFVFKLF
ncbi:vanin-like protein 1 isoform X3 [Anticarsia gemmatalis]|uniref:vanin-like protein 1 isoform X3 n=1 Tax=Anticarsia gemmatalis TaxID=129554 RepID=UPI003F76A013